MVLQSSGAQQVSQRYESEKVDQFDRKLEVMKKWKNDIVSLSNKYVKPKVRTMSIFEHRMSVCKQDR